MSFQGKQIPPEVEELVVRLKQHYDKEKKDGQFVSTDNPALRTANSLGIGITSVKNIMARYRRNGEKIVNSYPRRPGRPPAAMVKNAQPVVRQFIRSENLAGQKVGVGRVGKYLKSEHGVEIPKMTLWRALKRWGFTYGEGRRRNCLKEKDYAIKARRHYLRLKRANRNADGTLKRPEVYLDETFINKNHSARFTWYLDGDGPWVNKPAGVGPRLIIVHAITRDGWVDNAGLFFEAKKRTGDFRGQMNWDNFSKWFARRLLKNIPPKSIVVLDNARYHNVSDAKTPGINSTKKQLRDWLSRNNHKWSGDMLKPELLEMCKKIAPAPQYCLDQIAAEYDISILRTPQYHPELQPIESCWAVVKNYMADNCDFTMKGMREKLPEAFAKVTSRTCRRIIAKVVAQEEKYWNEDSILDEKYGSDVEGGSDVGYENYLDEI